jgi:hypothetical protein
MLMKIQYETRLFGSHACLTIWPALMLGALAVSSQSARGLFISRSLNPESCVTAYRFNTTFFSTCQAKPALI